jgi:serine/threonine protein kinase
VTAQIGAGGMGEVYRAFDTTLSRHVAIKVLPVAFSSDPERLARFEREARTLAALNHPGIAHIYGVEEGPAEAGHHIRALVMELVEGETLADRIARGPIPLHEATDIARRIAEALEAAHEQGIIHRDLKPDNVKLRPDGVVKVLDFGLAKALASDVVESGLTNSPTLSLGATRAGVILGTAAFMSPEQANGYAVDRRADIWSFGAVLYEMLTGRKAFPGESVSDTLATVLKIDPDWNALPAATPAAIRTLLRRCLTRDRKQRLQSIGEARIALEHPEEPASIALAPSLSRLGLWASVSAGAFAVAFAAISFVHFREAPSRPGSIQRFEVPMPDPRTSGGIVSPDGARLMFFLSGVGATEGSAVSRGAFWVRALDSFEGHFISGTETSVGLPFWSDDGRFIAFTTRDGKLRTVDVASGTVQILGDARAAIGGFWTSRDTIVFSDSGKLLEVPAHGGTPSPLRGITASDAFDVYPIALPDGRHFTFTRFQSGFGTYIASQDDGSVAAQKLMDGIVVAATPSTAGPTFCNLLFLQNPTLAGQGPPVGRLMAQRFDLRTLATIGEAIPISDNVGLTSASRTGVLVFMRAAAERGDQLTIFDRQGKTIQALGEPGDYSRMSFSPDGSRIIAARSGSAVEDRQIWMFDLARSLASRFPTDPAGGAFFPLWSPDGNRIVFASDRGGTRNLYSRLSNGGGDDELFFKPDGDVIPLSWSRNGRFLGIGANAEDETHWAIPLDDKGQPGKPALFVRRGLGLGIEFSPDPNGPPRWVAYQATRDGRTEVYLREFDPDSPTLTPADAGEWQVSKGGGTAMHWNPNGRELFYLAPDRTLMAAQMTGNKNAPTAVPKAVFKPTGIERASQAGVATLSWAVSPDGTRFLFPIPLAAGGSTPRLSVILNWTSLLPQ